MGGQTTENAQCWVVISCRIYQMHLTSFDWAVLTLTGRMVSCPVTGIAYRRPQGEQLEMANPVRNDETGLWQCPFCQKNDFPELGEVRKCSCFWSQHKLIYSFMIRLIYNYSSSDLFICIYLKRLNVQFFYAQVGHGLAEDFNTGFPVSFDWLALVPSHLWLTNAGSPVTFNRCSSLKC